MSRLRQMSALLERIELLNAYINVTLLPADHPRRVAWKGGIPTPFSVWQPHVEELTLWTDCFYHIAWRAVCITASTNPKAFPGLGTITAVGIRDVRNHLIQHPQASALAQAWTLSAEAGPRLKPLEHRPGSKAPDDRGVFANAEEFRTTVNASLEHATRSLGNPA